MRDVIVRLVLGGSAVFNCFDDFANSIRNGEFGLFWSRNLNVFVCFFPSYLYLVFVLLDATISAVF